MTREQRSHLGGIGLVNLATLTWATNIALGRWLSDDVGPLTLAAARFLIGSLFFAALLRGKPAPERRLGADRWLLLGMALSGVVLFVPILYRGLHFTTAVNATLISSLGPLLTGLLAALLIGEPMTRRQLGGAVAGLLGVGILISGGNATFWRAMQVNSGDLLLLGAAGLWALYSVLSRQVTRRRSALSATAFTAFLALPCLLPAAAWELRTQAVQLRPEIVAALLYIGVAPTVIGLVAWNEGVRRLGSSGAMVFYNTLPLYGALLGTLFLGESLGPGHLAGGALIVGGGLWAARGVSAKAGAGSRVEGS